MIQNQGEDGNKKTCCISRHIWIDKKTKLRFKFAGSLQAEGNSIRRVTVIEYVSCFRRKDKGFHSDKDYLIGHLETSIEKGLAADINIGLIILSYKGKTIGFTTYGDAKADVRNNYETALRYTNGQLDLFICARHADNDVRTELDKSEEIISNIEIIPSKRMSMVKCVWCTIFQIAL